MLLFLNVHNAILPNVIINYKEIALKAPIFTMHSSMTCLYILLLYLFLSLFCIVVNFTKNKNTKMCFTFCFI